MAEFKKIPGGGSGDGPFDAITAEMAGQFAATYWPVVLGGITLFVLILRGNERAAIPVGAVVVLLQAWRLGLFG
jgi:hypothetical protein